MKISESWLREWVKPGVTTEALVEQLTLAGLEVDDVYPAAPAFQGVVVGRVVSVSPHPDADRLRVCSVDVGGAEPLQIVCGAPNVFEGMHAPTAVVGAVLPGDFKIKRSKLRGVESQGMLCSAKELGLSDDAAGLLALPHDSPLGRDLRDYLALDDTIIDVDLTPNRGDCLGLVGVAREVGVLNRCDLSPIPVDPVTPDLDATFPVRLETPADCPRYVGRVIRGVNPQAETPLWMRERLRRVGLRSLGPLVDVTNYVMLELGQPMHAFDLGKLQGGIVVRRGQTGERLELLNGATVDLNEDILVIADQAGPLALAGIMGGETSAVGDDTCDVFLESAFFTPTSIAGRARRFGLHTDSSHRFERGVDPELQVRAAERATRLLLDIAGGRPGPVLDVAMREHLPAKQAVRLRPARLHKLLGLEIAPTTVVEILQRLGMAVAEEGQDWLVAPPSFRFDITLEADLIEEVGRVHGYDKVPSNRPLTRLDMAFRPESEVRQARLRNILVQRGFHEAITFSFVEQGAQRAMDPEGDPIPLANPISSDLAVMRTTLLPGLLKALGYNQKRQQARVRLFESGLGFIREGSDLRQDPRIAAVACGLALPEQWGAATRAMDFYDLKADVETLIAATADGDAFQFVADRHPALHPGQSARIDRDGHPVGWIGALHPMVARRLDLEGDVFLFELMLTELSRGRVPRYAELSKFPIIRRDLALVVDETVTARSMTQAIRAAGGDWLREIHVFDVYRGKGIEEGQKSLAFGLILQDFSRTLTDEDVDGIIREVIVKLEKEFGATLRV